jgi:hypothetical protein
MEYRAMPPFDLQKTQALGALFVVPPERRDDAWRARFFENIAEASLACGNPQVSQGPDGFPYFALSMPQAGKPFDAFCVAHVLDLCIEKGFGIVINPAQGNPDWVFTYGDLCDFRTRGTFEDEPVPAPPEPSAAGRQVMVGAPSEEFLLPSARAVIRAFLKQVGVKEPRVLLLIDPRAVPSKALAFSFFPDEFPSMDHYNQVLGRLGWFLPRGRGVVGLPRNPSLTDAFLPL